MKGKIVLITGANRGVGYFTASELALLGAEVVMVCRDPLRGSIARDAIAKVASGAPPALLLADLSSQASIRLLAKEVRTKWNRIDVLLNNASAMFARRELTIDGIEKTLATNHLTSFLLTNLLLDLLLNAPQGRVVTVASEDHWAALDFNNLQGGRRYGFFNAYRRSKLANIMITYELARRLRGAKATANCVSPGPTRTGFGDEMRGLPGLFPRFIKRIPFLLVPPEKGARTSIYAASAPELAGISGRFYLRGRERRTRKITYNPDLAARLWTVSEKLVGLETPQEMSAESPAPSTFRQ